MNWPPLLNARTHGPLRLGVVAACPFPVPQGSQVYIEQSVRALQREGHTVQLLCYAHGLGAPPPDIHVLRAPALPRYTRTKAGPAWAKPLLDLMLAREIRRAAKRHGWQAVVAHNYEGLAAALLAGMRPIIYMAHNAMADELPCYFRGARWATRFGTLLDRALPRRADAVVAPHQRLAHYLRECGCESGSVYVRQPELPVLPEPISAPQGEPFVLYTGNLDPYQNIPLLMEAMALVRKEMPGAKLVVATHANGQVPGAEMVRLSCFGDLLEILRGNCIVACARTSWSGYPIKLLNAVAAGRPAVVFQSAAGPIVNGVNGWTVPDRDTTAMAKALLQWLRREQVAQLSHGSTRTEKQEEEWWALSDLNRGPSDYEALKPLR